MWIRPDGIILKLCDWGVCVYTEEGFDMNAGSSLGMGWSYLLIPIVIGIVIGFVIGYLIKKRKNDAP